MGLRSIAVVHRERRLSDRTQTETAYFLSSLPADAERIPDATRAHWAIENSFHWTLDVTFAEDASTVRLDNAPENFAVLRHVAFNLLKRHPYKASPRRKRFRAALDDSFLYELLPNFDAIALHMNSISIDASPPARYNMRPSGAPEMARFVCPIPTLIGCCRQCCPRG